MNSCDTTRYPLILMLCCDVFMFLVKQGVPSDEELEWLSQKLENWKVVGRRLKIDTPTLTAFHMENRGWFEKSYRMLKKQLAHLLECRDTGNTVANFLF